MGSKILVVEDEADLAELVAFNLREAGHEVSTAGSGSGALAQIRQSPPDLLILDVMLPDISGLEVCRRIRLDEATSAIPVIMLTAKGSEADRIEGFELGADDYVTKPFSPRELNLRVDALLRRAGSRPKTKSEEAIEIGCLEIDVAAHRVSVHAEEKSLTALEFRLLLDLAKRQGRVQSRNDLLERVWGYAPGVETRTVDTHVKRLREKLGDEAAALIETVRGVGYRMRKG